MKHWTLSILAFVMLFSFSNTLFAQPTGFVDQEFVGTFDQAVGLTFDDNGRMYVYEKGGKVWIVENGQVASSPLLDISEEVGNWRDFGMLGFVLDPNFLSNGYMYCLYLVDRHHLLNFGTNNYNPNTDEYFNATIGRITRFQADAATGFTTLVPNSRNVLLGENVSSDGFASLHQSHGTGSLVFGTDGTLLASFGDGASYSSVDQGSASETYWQQAINDGIITSAQNIGAYRVQLNNNLAGKLIRIDPATGNGISSNPYYQSNNPASAQSKIFAKGLRNPCRMTLKPETGSHDPADADPGVIYIGDVGWGNREELNVVDGSGLNFAWPKFEGMTYQPGYNNSTYEPSTHERAKIDWRNGTARGWVNNSIVNVGSGSLPGPNFTGNCSIGGVWYNGDDFPAEWKNTYFHADYGGDWIINFSFDENNTPTQVRNFKTGADRIVFIATDPVSGGLYYIAGASGGNPQVNNAVRRISFSGGNLPPFALASSNVSYGASPLTVDFKGDLSYDPNGDAITYNWDFGDGNTSTAANPSHTFSTGSNQPTSFTVTLTVSDGSLSEQQTISVSLNNTPPQILSTSIDNINNFSSVNATNLSLNATVSDAEHNNSQLTYAWFTELHHNNHFHAEPADNNASTSTLLSPVGCDGATYFYRIKLKVSDPAGLFTTYQKDIYPNCSGASQTISFDPVGDQLTINPPINLVGSASSGLPVIFHVVSGPASISGNTLSLNGTPGIVTVRAIQSGNSSFAPAIPVEYTFLVNPIGGTGLTGNYFDNINLTNQVLTRVDPTINFDWGTGTPDPSIGVNTFSVRWEGGLLPLFDETYTFTVTGDDGVRLWVNDQLIVDQWIDQSPTAHAGTITLTGGTQVPIRLEYYENGGGAVARLQWSSNSQSSQIIPSTFLFPEYDAPDTERPTVSLSTASNQVSGPFTVSVNFNENINGLSQSDFNISNATATALSGSGQSYTLTVNPSSDGTVTVRLPGNRVQDNAGNTNTASNTISVNYTAPDNNNPSVSLFTASTNVSAAFEVRATFSETISGLTLGDFQVTNGTVNDLSNIGLDYFFMVAPTADGPVSVRLPANRVQDGSGNGNTVSNTLNVNYTAPGNGDCNTPTNIALNKTTSQSSVYSSGGAESDLAVDGNTNGNWYSAYSVSSTSWDNQPWWEVDLGSVSEIQTINIWNRTDCCSDFLSDYYVLISDSPFTSDNLNDLLNQPGLIHFHQTEIAGAPSVLSINQNGRYVRIQNSGAGFMALAEVEVLGCENGSNPGGDTSPPEVTLSTSNTNVSAPFSVNTAFNEVVTGLSISDFTISNGTASALSGSGSNYSFTLTPNADGAVSIQLPANRVQDAAGNNNNASNTLNITYTAPGNGDCSSPTNVALNKPASVSNPYGSGAGPELAVDGNTNGNWYSDYSVASTSWANQPWWEVDLEAIYSIEFINLWNRTDCCSDFLSDYYVLVSDVPFITGSLNEVLNQAGVTAYHQTSIAGAPSAITIGRTGRFVRIQNSGAGFVALAEAEVFGCINNNGGDNTPPEATLSASTQNATDNFGLTATFTENIIGLSENDFTITNGSITGLNGSGQTYSMIIMPNQAGQVSITLSAGRVTDIAGNANLASNTVNVNYDPPPTPTVSILDPTEGSIISGDEVIINFQVSGDLVGNNAEHLLLTLDGNAPVDLHDIGTAGTYTFTGVPPGSHTLLVQLADNFHVPLSFPESSDEVNFTTIENSGGMCTVLENLALNGNAYQSSDYNGGGAEAALAIDGNTSGAWFTDYSVASTSWSVSPWWEVDLGAVYNIEEINIWNRTDCCSDFLSDYYILVSDEPFISGSLSSVLAQPGVIAFQETTTAGTPTVIGSATTGRYVRIQNSNAGFVALGEVEVMGCPIANVNGNNNSGFVLQNNGNQRLDVSLFPNPAKNSIIVNYDSKKAGNLRYIIANSQGLIYKEDNFEIGAGEGQIITKVRQWPAGHYIFYIKIDGYRFEQIQFIRIRD